ncbi:MAG: outer membrane protein assembly factor BamA [Pseudomonadota bacterium]
MKFKFLASLILIIFLCFYSAAVFAARVAEVNVTGLTTLSEVKVKRLIGIEAGEEFSLQELDRSMEYLRKWGVFDVIEVSPSMTPEGVILDYHLEEATIVASIDIAGNYPYIENKVRKHLSIHPGDIYTPDRLLEQIDRIKDFYKREGFVGTEVYIEEEPRPAVHGVALTFHICRGELIRYRKIDVSGNTAFPKGRIVSAINPLKPYSERRLRLSLRKLRDFYHKSGYPKARVKLISKKIDFENLRVDIAIAVNEGPHVEVRFVGALHTSRRLLKKKITIFSEGAIDQFEIETSADAIKELMKERGYPHAKVDWEKTTLEDGTILITFIIDEGKPQRIRGLCFDGNEDVSSKDIRKDMQNKKMSFSHRGAYYPDLVSDDDEVIITAMKQKGYVDAKVDKWDVEPTPQGYALDVIVPIDAGDQIIVRSVAFVGGEQFTNKQQLKALKIKPDKPLDEPGLADDKDRLIAFYGNNGYPYAKVEQSVNIDESTNTADIRYDIEQGQFVKIGRIFIVGDVLTSQNAIMSAMDIKEGQPFSHNKLVNSQLNIRRLGPFSYATIETIGIAEKRSIVHLKVKVEEQRPFLIDLGFSYSTDDSLTGTFAFRNINSFGWAKTNSLKLTVGRDLSRAELSWLDPRFLGSSFEMTAASWVQYKRKPVYAFTQIAGAIGWVKRLSRWDFFFRYELDRNYFVEGDSTAADADSLRNNTISRISLSSSYDSRDSFSYPTRGMYTYGGVDIFNEIKGNNADFVKFTWQFENDYGFFKRLVFSTALRTSHIQGIGSNVSVPTNELLFLGGDDTIRGYSEDSLGPTDANGNPTGSRTRWILNQELRMRIWRNLGIAGFFDMGSLTSNYSDIGWRDVRKSAGVGLRYNTPVGPIRADYGFKIGRRAGESVGRFHFTFGYVF